jgi:ribosomal protein L11 methyltransferase
MYDATEWFEFRCYAATPLKDAIVNRLFEMGAEGVTEEESLTPNTASAPVRAFFRGQDSAVVEKEMQEYLTSLHVLFPESAVSTYAVKEVEKENWADTYKQFYKPQRLTNRFFLQPKWNILADIPADTIPIIMDPGQAFGTGLHASTKLCIKMIQHAVKTYLRPNQITMLDIGTGTGILAIGRKGLGHRQRSAGYRGCPRKLRI